MGTDERKIVEETRRLLENEDHYRQVAQARNPYGDGHATERILDVLAEESTAPGRVLEGPASLGEE